MTFLNDVPPYGGGTVVCPGSPGRLEQFAQSDPGQYDLMWSLNRALSEVELGEPVELTHRRGEGLFYRYLCAHVVSMNVSDQPCLALN